MSVQLPLPEAVQSWPMIPLMEKQTALLQALQLASTGLDFREDYEVRCGDSCKPLPEGLKLRGQLRQLAERSCFDV